MKAEAEELKVSVEASALGKDYPEGRVIQRQRGTPWFEMDAYRKQYSTFKRLKPSWNPPSKKKESNKNKK